MERILKSNLEIKKNIHQLRFYDIPTREILNDTKAIIVESTDNHKFCRDSLSYINNLYDKDVDIIIEGLEKVIEFRENYVYNMTIIDGEDFESMVEETYIVVENIIYETFKEVYELESDYISQLIDELDTVTEAEKPGYELGKDIATGVGKAGKAVMKGASAIWQTLLGLVQSVRESFMTKHRKITERDAKWLKEHESTLRSLNTANMEINIHSDHKKRLSEARAVYNTFKGIVDANALNVNTYDEFREKIKQFLPGGGNGNLKEGLLNRYRTGNVTTPYSIVVIRGNAIKNPINDLISYCNEFISNFENMNKEFKDSEQFIKKLQQQVKARKITTENYCYVEESLYGDTELGLFYDFDAVHEADNSSVGSVGVTNTAPTPNNNATNNTNGNVNNNADDNNKPKVNVATRNDVKEKTDAMDDGKLALYNKICRDRHLGLTCFMTATEKKYFESITILRGLISKSN